MVDNLAPTAAAVATPQTGKAPLAVSFDGSGSTDEDGNVVAWDWNFDDGSTGSGEVAIHVFNAVGTYDVELTVTDDGGATDTTTVTVVVNELQPPVAVANATPDGTKAPLGVLFSSVGSTDPDGSIIGYSWDFDDGSPLSTSANPSHLYTVAGTYDATLTVTDDDFLTTTATVPVIVGPSNVPPVASGTATPAVGKPILNVQFSSAASTDSDGSIVSYSWNFGDGSPVSTDPNPSHTYSVIAQLQRPAHRHRRRWRHQHRGHPGLGHPELPADGTAPGHAPCGQGAPLGRPQRRDVQRQRRHHRVLRVGLHR